MSGNDLFDALKKRKDEEAGEKKSVLNINKTWEGDLKKTGKEDFADDIINAIDTALSAKDPIIGFYEITQKLSRLEQRVLNALGPDVPLIKEVKEYLSIISGNMKEMSRVSRLASNQNTEPNMAATYWGEHKNYINGTKAYMNNNRYKFLKYKSNVFNKG